MSDLTEFLLARIAEDEAAARAATPGPWRWDHAPTGEWGHQPPDLVTVASREGTYMLNDGTVKNYTAPLSTVISSRGYDADGLDVSNEDAAHIARHDPARVLAECEAGKVVVQALSWHTITPCDCSDDPRCTGWQCSLCRRRWPCESHMALRALAAPRASHPDYREEWKP